LRDAISDQIMKAQPKLSTCIVEGLVGGEAFSVDASLIKVDVNPAQRVPGNEPITSPERAKASRVVRDILDTLDQDIAEPPTVHLGKKRRPRMENFTMFMVHGCS